MTDPRTTRPAATEDPEYAANLRRATLASSIGSALEYFDFALYGLSTALIFNVLFFPQDDPAMATVAAFATFGVGFLARPFGGLFFGVLGDRLGRKWVLVATILLMGGASTAIGLLPTYEAIGLWAPILLVLMRLLQGFGAGAEQAGATVLMAEYAPVRRRGFFAALPFIGIQAGTLLAALVFSFISLLPTDALMSWGWRVPFLASFALILLALFIRMRLRETPTFIELEKHEQIAERPVRDIFTHGLPGVIVASACAWPRTAAPTCSRRSASRSSWRSSTVQPTRACSPGESPSARSSASSRCLSPATCPIVSGAAPCTDSARCSC